MATTKIYIHEIGIGKLKDFQNFKLCYVDEIPKTYMDYTTESKALMQTEEYKEYMKKRREYLDELLKKNGHVSSHDYDDYAREHDPEHKFHTDMQDYPTPDILDGYTHYLYFTNDLEKQWGDDWDDAPYEYNAETPYDHDTEIIIIPICLTYFSLNDLDDDKEFDNYPNYSKCDIKFPKDWGGINSPFCVDDINGGAVAWIYATLSDMIYVKKHIAIHGGENPETVYNKIVEINNLLL